MKNEAGAVLSCMTGNSAGSCAQITFLGSSGIAAHDAQPLMWYDPTRQALMVPTGGTASIRVLDATGRAVLQRTATNGLLSLSGLKAGPYLAQWHAQGTGGVLRFVLP